MTQLELGYTPPVNPVQPMYPPYFNIKQIETGYRITVRGRAVEGNHGLVEGDLAYIDVPEHFINELYDFLGNGKSRL
jgi:hypothetical protein